MSDPGGASVGDLDGDGLSDLMLTSWAGSGQRVFLGSQIVAGGSYQYGQSHSWVHLGSGLENLAPGSADINADGTPDVLINSGWSLDVFSGAVLLAGGEVEVADALRHRLRPYYGPSGPDLDFGDSAAWIPDLDGDGLPEIVLPTESFNFAEVWFGSTVSSRSQLNPGDVQIEADPSLTNLRVESAGDVDVDVDGLGDLLVGHTYGVFLVLGASMSGSGTLSLPADYVFLSEAGWFGRVLAGGGDVNGDGRDDLLFGDRLAGDSGQAHVLLSPL
jgi:hypothetical protein